MRRVLLAVGSISLVLAACAAGRGGGGVEETHIREEAASESPAQGDDGGAGPGVCEDPFVADRVIPVDLELTEEAWQEILANPVAEEFQQGAFVFDGVRVEDVGIRTKGNSSLNFVAQMGSERFSFKVDFNLYVKGQDFCGLKKVVFNNGFKDPTLLREHLAYRLARELGLKASRTAFVDLSVAGRHLGLYTMVEPVDEDLFLEANFGNDDGDMYKPEFPDAPLVYKGKSFTDYQGIEAENNEDTTDHSALMKLIDVINHGPAEDYAAVLDVDLMLRYIAFDTVLVNLDSYTGNGHNYYIYEQEGVFSIIPWDLNEAFGNFNCGGCPREKLIGFLVDEPTCGPTVHRPLAAALLAVPEHRSKYHQYLQGLLDGPFSPAAMGGWIEEAADLIRPYVQADTTKFFSTEEFEQGLVDDVDVQGLPRLGEVVGLQAFVEERGAAIADQLAGVSASAHNGDGNCSGPGPGPNPVLCPDGVCDAAEQADPNLCPEDC